MSNLLFTLMSKPWAIDTQFAQSNVALVNAIVNGNISELPKSLVNHSYKIVSGKKRTGCEDDEPCDDEGNEGEDVTTFKSAAPNSVAIISISGVMLKNDRECGPRGTATICNWIKQADANEDITGIVLKLDSPGGTVDGTEELGRVVKACKTPIVCFVDGMACSAAYWTASQCDKIIISGKTSYVGSIGTMISWYSYKKYLENEGISAIEIYATESTDKNKDFNDAENGDTAGLVKKLDAINSVFLTAVNSGRAGKFKTKENVLSGKTYLSAEAIKYGLADAIGTLQDAINATTSITTKNKKMSKAINNFPKVSAIAGWENGFESTDQGVYVQSTELEALETALVNAEQTAKDLTIANQVVADNAARIAELEATTDNYALATAQSELASATATIDNHVATIESLNDTVATLTAKVTELESKPANTGSNAVGQVEPIEGTAPKSKYVPDGSESLLEKYTGR